MKNLYIENRRKVADALADGGFLVLFAGSAPRKRGDEFHAYSPQRNFYYCTGICGENMILTLYKKGGEVKETLYLEEPDESKSKWVGAPVSEAESRQVSGIEKYKFLGGFEANAASLLHSGESVLYLDLENHGFNAPKTPETEFAAKVREYFPATVIRNANPLFAALRAVKSAGEIKMIGKAAEITRAAFRQLYLNAKPGMAEYEAAALFEYEIKKRGAQGTAFATIAASGSNAAVLHYTANSRTTEDGDLLLVDAGAQYGFYSADVTRTFPVNGKFTDRQRLLYEIVLRGQERVIDAVGPGVRFGDLNDILVKYYEKELKKIGLITEKEEVGDFYYHRVSHHLGLETHDVGRMNDDGELAPGMVLTVEPGLYIEEEGIGIRIEDDVTVTVDGCEVLTAGIPKSVDEIEKIMRTKNGR